LRVAFQRQRRGYPGGYRSAPGNMAGSPGSPMSPQGIAILERDPEVMQLARPVARAFLAHPVVVIGESTERWCRPGGDDSWAHRSRPPSLTGR